MSYLTSAVVFAGVLGLVICVSGLVIWRLTRTDPEMDRHLSAVDEDIDRRRIADAQERAAADQFRQQHNITALPQREPAQVVPFPTDENAS